MDKAAALTYHSETDSSPKLTAKGKGELAQRIIKKAQEFGIPLFKNELLVDSLLKMDLGDEIPPQLYRAVVEVFIWLSHNEREAQLSY